jgi:hypothetical protein
VNIGRPMTWTLLGSGFRLKWFKRFSFQRYAAANFGLRLQISVRSTATARKLRKRAGSLLQPAGGSQLAFDPNPTSSAQPKVFHAFI